MREAFETAALDILAAIGELATFTPAAGDPVELYVDLVLDALLEPYGYEAQISSTAKTIEYALSDIGRSAAIGETFLVGETTYTVVRETENDGVTAKVIVR